MDDRFEDIMARRRATEPWYLRNAHRLVFAGLITSTCIMITVIALIVHMISSEDWGRDIGHFARNVSVAYHDGGR